MFLDTKAKVASVTEVVLPQLIFPDFETSFKNLFSLGTTNSAMNRNFFISNFQYTNITNLSAAATHYRMMKNTGAASKYRYALAKMSFTGEPVDRGGHPGSRAPGGSLTVAGQRRTCTGFPHRPIGTPIDRPSRTSEPVTPIPMRTIAGAMPRVQRSDSEADLRVLRPFRCAPTSASLGDDRREVVRSVTLHAVAGTVDHDHLRRRIAAMEFGHIGVGDHG